MSKINLLPEQLINQIAAGEVVERPGSVVKELLENSIDAGASKIIIEVKNGGIDLIKITDNGCGMAQDDALLCLERHATSKIKSLEDLHNVRTMGFRGEAMASIASVSKLNLRTRQVQDQSGVEILTEGGKVLKMSPIGCPEGTEIEILELFYNTPARLKFLKSEQTEYQNIVDCVLNAALVFPKVAFRLINGDKIAFDLPACEDELVRLRGVLGKSIVDDLIPVFYGGVNLKMTGYIGKPNLTRANKNMQYFFVNDRPINSHVLSYAIKQAYHSLIPKERNPVFVVKFELEPSMVDVNCHPRKTEIKFTDEREVYRVLTSACNKSLQENVLMPKMNFNGNDTPTASQSVSAVNYYREKRPEGLAQLTMDSYRPVVNEEVAVVTREEIMVNNEVLEVKVDQNSFSEWRIEKNSTEGAIVTVDRQQWTEKEEEKIEFAPEEMLVIGQLNKSFILCQKGTDLVIVDQHAAHERIRYNKLMAEGENEEKVIQPLLAPVNVELSQQDIAVLNSNKEALEAVGMGIEHFGGNTFAITEVPAFLAKSNLEKVLLGLLDDFRNGVSANHSGSRMHGQETGIDSQGHSHKGDFFARKEKILTYLACRSAVKFGDTLSNEEMVALIEQINQEKFGKATCPHGRPTMIALDSEELWSRFGRKYTGFFEKEKFGDVNC